MKRTIALYLLICLTQTGMSQTIDVLTYNIKYDNPKDSLNSWENRKDFLISQLNFYTPDVFGTQEGLRHQLRDIENGLEDYAFFGVGRDNGNEEGEFTAIFYNTEKFILLSESTFWLSKTPEKPSKGWDAALPRICTYGLFKIKKNNRQFYVFNTHFDHVGENAREESAKLILNKIEALNNNDLPVILMGDFNLEENASGIKFILKELADTHALAGKNSHGPIGTFNGFHFAKPVTRRIDYIFVDKAKLKVLKNGILSDSKDCSYPSDHLPVYTELKFEN
ncbi:MAG: endonuclease/exonuclease/phosphatase family protein [Flavobacteriaceae bacterium]